MSELDLGLVTSIITFICLVIFGYFTGESIGKNEVVGFAGSLAGLIVWYYTEKYNSHLVSGSGEINTELILGNEEVMNAEYEEEVVYDEEQV